MTHRWSRTIPIQGTSQVGMRRCQRCGFTALLGLSDELGPPPDVDCNESVIEQVEREKQYWVEWVDFPWIWDEETE